MEFNIPDAHKRTMLATVRDGLESEIYSMLVKMGIDPDTFDGSTGLESVDGSFTGERLRTKELLNALDRVKEKLAEIE